jgi:hypothetical protein
MNTKVHNIGPTKITPGQAKQVGHYCHVQTAMCKKCAAQSGRALEGCNTKIHNTSQKRTAAMRCMSGKVPEME